MRTSRFTQVCVTHALQRQEHTCASAAAAASVWPLDECLVAHDDDCAAGMKHATALAAAAVGRGVNKAPRPHSGSYSGAMYSRCLVSSIRRHYGHGHWQLRNAPDTCHHAMNGNPSHDRPPCMAESPSTGAVTPEPACMRRTSIDSRLNNTADASVGSWHQHQTKAALFWFKASDGVCVCRDMRNSTRARMSCEDVMVDHCSCLGRRSGCSAAARFMHGKAAYRGRWQCRRPRRRMSPGEGRSRCQWGRGCPRRSSRGRSRSRRPGRRGSR